MDIASQAITENVGVAVTQGAVSGSLKTAVSNEWTLTIAAQDITASAGAAVTQGSVSGTLKTALSGSTTSVIVLTASNVIFSSTANVMIGGTTTVLAANLNAASNNGATTQIVIQTLTNSIVLWGRKRKRGSV